MAQGDTITPRLPRIILAASGSVAANKFGKLCHYFSKWAEVKAVITDCAYHFLDTSTIPEDIDLYRDDDDWDWNMLGDKILHIELCRWADILVIAPLSANTLAKIAGGLCDNLLTCVVRAWDYDKPFFIAPAMNTLTWKNSFTETHLMAVDELGVTLIPPVTKKRACGDYGNGAMAKSSIINMTVQSFVELQPLPAGSNV
ncbi:phosphopantothenoylcysteine decarboxylase-like isoform X2 [Amaranthus tricolor]|nr:phosphopantothenoylcysteine decarboxylase-like isoform X2 [Amaranthus tricolor]XP_057540541.1 phosphopantothenoylcysteine decarboxylase-like isoform X2 [Amaranthus tricolor]